MPDQLTTVPEMDKPPCDTVPCIGARWLTPIIDGEPEPLSAPRFISPPRLVATVGRRAIRVGDVVRLAFADCESTPARCVGVERRDDGYDDATLIAKAGADQMPDQLTTVQQLARKIGRSERAIEKAAKRLGFRKVNAFGIPRWLFTAEQCEAIAANTHDGPGQPRKVRAEA